MVGHGPDTLECNGHTSKAQNDKIFENHNKNNGIILNIPPILKNQVQNQQQEIKYKLRNGKVITRAVNDANNTSSSGKDSSSVNNSSDTLGSGRYLEGGQKSSNNTS